MCDYRLVGNHQKKNVFELHTNHSSNTLSRNDFQWLVKGESMFVTSEFEQLRNSLSHTSFAGFRMDSLFNPFVSFVVSHTGTLKTEGLIPFQTALIGASKSWLMSKNQFVVPNTGSYFFTLNTCAAAHSVNYVFITTNVGGFVFSRKEHDVHDGVETISRSKIAHLSAGDTVGAYLRL